MPNLYKPKFLDRDVRKTLPGHPKGSGRKLNKFLNIRRARQVNNVRINNRIPDNDLVIMEGCLEGGKPLRILIDSARQAELIPEQVAKELNKNITESSMMLATVEG